MGQYPRILVKFSNRSWESTAPVKENIWYELNEDGTNEQNRLFHLLLSELFKENLHSYDITSYEDMRSYVKRDFGAGFEYYFYIKNDELVKTTNRDEIPNPKKAKGVLKSWSKYTKKERTSTIDQLINYMILIGHNSQRFNEILEKGGK